MTITIADITVPPDQFELGHLVADNPDLYVEFERLVPLDESILPFLWVENSSKTHVEASLASQPEVKAFQELTEVDGRILYQIEWTEGINGLIEALIETNGVILEGYGSARQWDFRIRFPEQVSLGRFNRMCEQADIDISLRSVYGPYSADEDASQLTRSQRETLLAAYELGFFEIPREVSMKDLADEFGVSEQAISQRLRRGMANVLADRLRQSGNTGIGGPS